MTRVGSQRHSKKKCYDGIPPIYENMSGAPFKIFSKEDTP